MYLASGEFTANAEDIKYSMRWAVAHQILEVRRTADLLPSVHQEAKWRRLMASMLQCH